MTDEPTDQHPDQPADYPDDVPAFERPQRPLLDDRPGAPLRPGRPLPRFDPGDRPAPVVTDSGTFGTLPEDEPFVDLGDDGWLRALIARIAMFALLGMLALWLLVLSAHQVTDREVALPALEREVAALTELDALLVMHHDEIAATGASRAAEPGSRVEVPGFPITEATLTAIEARDLTPDEQRPLVLGQAAEAVYTHGPDAFLAEGATAVAAGQFSTEGFARRLMSFLTADNHDRIGGWLRVIGAIAIAITAAVVLLGRGFGRLGALAVPLLGAAAIGVGAALVLRLIAGLPGGDGSFSDELSAIAQGLAWTPARNALWFAAAGVAIALPAALGGLLLGERYEHISARGAVYDLDAYHDDADDHGVYDEDRDDEDDEHDLDDEVPEPE